MEYHLQTTYTNRTTINNYHSMSGQGINYGTLREERTIQEPCNGRCIPCTKRCGRR